MIAQADEQALADWLADETMAKACHDAKWAIHALRVRGWTLRGSPATQRSPHV